MLMKKTPQSQFSCRFFVFKGNGLTFVGSAAQFY
jgi:hypothetical protein